VSGTRCTRCVGLRYNDNEKLQNKQCTDGRAKAQVNYRPGPRIPRLLRLRVAALNKVNKKWPKNAITGIGIKRKKYDFWYDGCMMNGILYLIMYV